ncbi:cell division protein FtsZ [Sphingomonas lenta]|uniref:Cell division protein FtsZ n=1 Tax=Sphingomonas lenta TaxID=1141887 RepID=A0A2A2SHL8_9SPHN|nr:cell division protein FtsZ [Sphingomonas lenta]PAX08705.1 cell division protein FtsZ [Sphingomonas lenta]
MPIEFMDTGGDVDELTPRIAVVGVGGAGGNAIANMMRADVQGVEFLVANTDAQALKSSTAPQRIQLGAKITQGLGAGARPEIGRAAAEETIDQLSKLLEGSHMCFIAAGMGGGTGTGAAPIIAKAARDMGILTVGVVTKPFAFEGSRRAKLAEAGIEELQKYVDTLIVIPNQNLFLVASANTTFKEAFEMADEVLQQGVRGITDLMIMPGLINLDFADVRSVMQEMGKAMMGTGEAAGDNRAIEAAQKAIANPLLDGVSLQGAKGVIISITGGDDMRLLEVDEAANHIRELVDTDANIIFGSAFNPDLEGKIRVSVVATGIDNEAQAAAQAQAPAETSRSFGFGLGGRKSEEPQSFRPAASASPLTAPTISAKVAPPAAAPAPMVSNASTAAPEPAEEPLDLSADDAVAADAQPETADAANEELVLGAETIVSQPPSTTADGYAGKTATPAPAADEGGARRRWLAPGNEATDEPAPATPRVKMGGTLFERMSNAARGAQREESNGAADKEGLDIPRFLHRQNNQ